MGYMLWNMLQAVRGMEDRGTEQGNMTALTNHRTKSINNCTKQLHKNIDETN